MNELPQNDKQKLSKTIRKVCGALMKLEKMMGKPEEKDKLKQEILDILSKLMSLRHKLNKGKSRFIKIESTVKNNSLKSKRKSFLRTWFDQHNENPYPSSEEKKFLCVFLQMEKRQLDTWFINERNRRWKRRKTDSLMNLPQRARS